MSAAMMAPLVVAPAHQLAVSSLWRRRYRAVAGYLAGYLGGWTLVGALMMTGLHVVRSWAGALPLVTVTGAAAVVVAATEDHRRRLRRCVATRPLALAGWARTATVSTRVCGWPVAASRRPGPSCSL